MKTYKIIYLGLFLFSICFTTQAQWLLTGNTNATASSFIGTTATNPVSGQDLIFKRAGVNGGFLKANATSFGLNSFATPNSVALGVSAGQFSSGLGGNTYIGLNAGKGQSLSVLNSGTNNTFVGNSTGLFNSTGFGNTFTGEGSGQFNSTGNLNTYFGLNSGSSNQTGLANVAFGVRAGHNCLGSYNTFLGFGATTEENSSGSGNVFIGAYAGFSIEADTSNNLVIGNTEQNQLIWGDFSASQIALNGKVGIGADALIHFGSFPTNAAGQSVSNYKLFVKGGILAEEVRVSLVSTWADYVFAKDYQLKSLQEVENFIAINGHLPNLPSAKQVKDEGINVGEMAKMQQEKIEELTLYIIEINKQLQDLKKQIKK